MDIFVSINLTLNILEWFSRWQIVDIFFYFSQKIGLKHFMQIVSLWENCMECDSLLSEERGRIFQNVVSWSFHPACKALNWKMVVVDSQLLKAILNIKDDCKSYRKKLVMFLYDYSKIDIIVSATVSVNSYSISILYSNRSTAGRCTYFLQQDKQQTLVTTAAFVLKVIAFKWIWCCKKSLMNGMMCKKGLVLFLFPHRI